MITLIPKDQVQARWKIYRDLIEATMEYTVDATLSLQVVHDKLREGKYHLVEARDGDKLGISIFEPITVNSTGILFAILTSGQFTNETFDALNMFYVIQAKKYFCSKVMLRGRVGWQKRLARYGYDVKQITMIKEVHY